jgi:hypothetical protein
MHDDDNDRFDDPSGDDLASGELPAAIVARLERQDRFVPIVAPRTDRAVADAARAYFAGRPRRAVARTRRWAVPLAAAAAILVAVLIVRPFDSLREETLADDVDGSGRVDILAAFALARANDGGAVALAERVVSLGVTR